jgi:glutathione S-transferase
MFLAEKGLEIPTVEVNILEGENLKEEFLAVNPRGVLPVLELDDGTYLDETVAICRYLEEEHPDPPLLGRNALEKAEIECWQRHAEFDGMFAVGEFFRNSVPPFGDRSLPGRSGDKQIPELIDRGRRGVAIFYQRLEDRLGASEFVGGASFSIADITALCVVDFAAFVGLPIPAGNHHTQAWHQKVSARSSAVA